MKLIREEIETVEVLTEETNGKKSFYITGPFLQGDMKNRNGRVYESRILAKEVARYNEQFISRSRALGELGHPDGPTVNLDRVSHNIVELYQDGSNFIGKAKILDTPMGKIAAALLSDGVQLGVSSRGMGSLVQREGVNYVGEDFHLATAADIVADPSAPDAFVQGIMEGKEWVWDNGLLKECDIEKVKRQIDNAPAHRLNEAILEGFHDLLMG
ncbi:prohead core protein [Synechococcus phage S-B68]|nr:prohead core protein [Synechococcus phage S-B68]